MPYARKNKMYSRNYNKNKKRFPFSRKQVQAIQKLSQMSGELKEYTTSSSHSNIDNTAPDQVSFNETGILQGDGDNQRIGDSLRPKDYTLNISFNSGTTSGILKVIVFQKLDDTTLNTLGMVNINDNLPTIQTAGGRYKVLRSVMTSVSSAGKKDSFLSIRIPSRSMKIKTLNYDTASGTLVSEEGVVRAIVLTNNSTASQLTSTFETRIRYYDN